MSRKFYIVFLLMILQPFAGYGSDGARPQRKRVKLDSSALLDGSDIPKLAHLTELTDEDRANMAKASESRYYRFTLHKSEDPRDQFSQKKYETFISELNEAAGKRAAHIAEPLPPVGTWHMDGSVEVGKAQLPIAHPHQWKYQLTDAYLEQMLGYSHGFVIVQVATYQRKNYFTGMGTLHDFQVWADDFSWNLSEKPRQEGPEDDGYDSPAPAGWLHKLECKQKPDRNWKTSGGECPWTRTFFPTLGEIGMLLAIGGGGKIVVHLENQAKVLRYKGILIASLEGAIPFYKKQGYLPIASPMALHTLKGSGKDSSKGQLMSYCHPLITEEPVTQADISKFLLKKFE